MDHVFIIQVKRYYVLRQCRRSMPSYVEPMKALLYLIRTVYPWSNADHRQDELGQ